MSARASRRMYQEYWLLLKRGNAISIKVPPLEAPTVKRMISKEKDRDIPYKRTAVYNGETPKLQFNYNVYKQELYVRLRIHSSLSVEAIT